MLCTIASRTSQTDRYSYNEVHAHISSGPTLPDILRTNQGQIGKLEPLPSWPWHSVTNITAYAFLRPLAGKCQILSASPLFLFTILITDRRGPFLISRRFIQTRGFSESILGQQLSEASTLMVDIVPIVIAVLALVGTLASAGTATWFAFYSDNRKILSESEKVLSKYRDPLLLAVQDLQSRLYNILDLGFIGGGKGENPVHTVQYTSFLVGQYFAWIYILRREAQFMRFDTDRNNRAVTKLLNDIAHAFATASFETDDPRFWNLPCMLWRGEQRALGEMMAVPDNNQLYCIGFAAFHQKWEDDPVFRAWFQPIVDGLGSKRGARNLRLRRLQHLLVDLAHTLDPDGVHSDALSMSYCKEAALCSCSHCSRLGKVDWPSSWHSAEFYWYITAVSQSTFRNQSRGREKTRHVQVNPIV